MPTDLIATHGHLAAAIIALDAGDYGSARAAATLAMTEVTRILEVSSPSRPVDRDNSRLVDSGSVEALAAAQPPVEETGSRPTDPQHPTASSVRGGTCWFCKGEFVFDALIAGYDTWEESRLACLACNERMSGNWRPAR